MRHWRHWPGVFPKASQCDALVRGIFEWIQIYEHLQQIGTLFIYVQIGCGLLGSLGRFYSGVAVAELAISLFALVAIESGSHLLFRIYLFLLGVSLLLDIFWFILVARSLGKLVIQSMVSVQATSSGVRLASTFVWFRVFQRDIACVYQPVNFDSRLETLGQPRSLRLPLVEDAASSSSPDQAETLSGRIYDPAYYSSLFQKNKDGELELIL